jgi:hypothetical protein
MEMDHRRISRVKIKPLLVPAAAPAAGAPREENAAATESSIAPSRPKAKAKAAKPRRPSARAAARKAAQQAVAEAEAQPVTPPAEGVRGVPSEKIGAKDGGNK